MSRGPDHPNHWELEGQNGEPEIRDPEFDPDWRTVVAQAPASEEERALFPQTRAIELCLPNAFDPADAPRLIWQVRRAGFNTVLLNCFSGGYTAFDSTTMRAWEFPAQDPRFADRDPVAPLLAAAHAERITVYALVECLRVGSESGKRGPILRRRSEWAAHGRDRSARGAGSRFLCPANRHVWRFLGDLLYEILEHYPFQGLYLRDLHYPLEPPDCRADYCRCDYCRSAVWHSLGVKIHEIPDDPDHPDRYNLTSWRSKQLAALLHYLRLRVGKVCAPSLTLAEVYLGEEGEQAHPESSGYVDAGSWTKEHLVPIAALRPLPAMTAISEQWIERVAMLTESALVMPVLSAEPDGLFLETLDRLSVLPIAGVVVREPYDLAAPPLNRLATGPWRERTQVTEERPLLAVCALLSATIRLLPADSPLSAFLSDVLRVVQPLGERWPPQQCETLYENLLGLEERIADEKMNLGEPAPAVVRNFRLARQLLRMVELEGS